MSVGVPATIWQDSQGLADFTNDGVCNIVDTTGAFLVDPSGVFIVDTGVIRTDIPKTIWEQDDSI